MTYVPIYCAKLVARDREAFWEARDKHRIGAGYAKDGRCCYCGERVSVVTDGGKRRTR